LIFVLTAEQMRRADEQAAATISRERLMRNAGESVAGRVRDRLERGGRVVAFAGPGDNGGDAFAALAALGPEIERVVYSVPSPKASAARSAAERRAAESGVETRPLPERDDEAEAALQGAQCALDGLFGTGSRLPLGERFHAAARALDARRRRVVAIDVPSGVNADDGSVGSIAVRATETVTLAALKPGLLLLPAREHVGSLFCAAIGIDDEILARNATEYAALDNSAFLKMLPQRALETEKRAAGAPLIVAGSRQFPGAAVLCALAAARAGAGYVTVATPASAAPALRMHLVEQVVVELDDAASAPHMVDTIADVSTRCSAIALGPGLALDDRWGEVVRGVIARTNLPVVVDASGLFHLGKHLAELRDKSIVLTPHAGEFARLSGKGTIAPGRRVARLHEFVERTGITTLLKGLDTLVYDARTTFINTTGTNALATAGTGDVLTGIVVTLLAQGLDPYDAARAGAYWHGLAGKAAARTRRRGVIARDVVDALADAIPQEPFVTDLRAVF
jgi:hydroxyethylthiazole kinase-like uncharacterized protein yjeF